MGVEGKETRLVLPVGRPDGPRWKKEILRSGKFQRVHFDIYYEEKIREKSGLVYCDFLGG